MNEAKVILLEEIKESFRNKKVLFVVFIYLALLIIGLKKAYQFSLTFGFLLSKFYFFTQQKPPYALLFFYFMSIIALPLFSLLLSYDSVSGELSKRTVRYLATRANRGYIIIGKFLGNYLVNISVNFLVYLVAVSYIYAKSGESVFIQGIALWLYLSIYSLYFVSLSLLASSFTSKPSQSLFLGAAFFVGLLLFLLKGSLKVISPYHYYTDGFYVLTGPLPGITNSIFVLILSSLIFIVLSLMIFKRRDL